MDAATQIMHWSQNQAIPDMNAGRKEFGEKWAAMEDRNQSLAGDDELSKLIDAQGDAPSDPVEAAKFAKNMMTVFEDGARDIGMRLPARARQNWMDSIPMKRAKLIQRMYQDKYLSHALMRAEGRQDAGQQAEIAAAAAARRGTDWDRSDAKRAAAERAGFYIKPGHQQAQEALTSNLPNLADANAPPMAPPANPLHPMEDLARLTAASRASAPAGGGEIINPVVSQKGLVSDIVGGGAAPIQQNGGGNPGDFRFDPNMQYPALEPLAALGDGAPESALTAPQTAADTMTQTAQGNEGIPPLVKSSFAMPPDVMAEFASNPEWQSQMRKSANDTDDIRAAAFAGVSLEEYREHKKLIGMFPMTEANAAEQIAAGMHGRTSALEGRPPVGTGRQDLEWAPDSRYAPPAKASANGYVNLPGEEDGSDNGNAESEAAAAAARERIRQATPDVGVKDDSKTGDKSPLNGVAVNNTAAAAITAGGNASAQRPAAAVAGGGERIPASLRTLMGLDYINKGEYDKAADLMAGSKPKFGFTALGGGAFARHREDTGEFDIFNGGQDGKIKLKHAVVGKNLVIYDEHGRMEPTVVEGGGDAAAWKQQAFDGVDVLSYYDKDRNSHFLQVPSQVKGGDPVVITRREAERAVKDRKDFITGPKAANFLTAEIIQKRLKDIYDEHGGVPSSNRVEVGSYSGVLQKLTGSGNSRNFSYAFHKELNDPSLGLYQYVANGVLKTITGGITKLKTKNSVVAFTGALISNAHIAWNGGGADVFRQLKKANLPIPDKLLAMKNWADPKFAEQLYLAIDNGKYEGKISIPKSLFGRSGESGGGSGGGEEYQWEGE
ncbi:MAG: hypothetical protein ACR2PR_09285 [Pseudohongiellaceae bacterium]